MLVVSRYVGEKLRVRFKPDGPVMWVHVSDIDKGRVRLGFDAPRDVEIMRTELLKDGPIPTKWGVL